MNPTEFLSFVFGDKTADEVVCVAKGSPKENGDTLFWNVAPDHEVFTRWTARPARIKEAWYFCVSTTDGTKNEKGTALRRGRAQLVRYHCLTLDDIGTKAAAPPVSPAWKLETSEGNFQWGYLLEPGSDWGLYEALLEWAHAQGWGDGGAGGCYRLMRLPGSCNLKPGRNKWVSKVEVVDDQVWKLEELAERLGCDLAKLARREVSRPVAVGGAVAKEGGIDDPMLTWLAGQGMVVKDEGKAWVEIVCPWGDQHTTGSNTAGYSPLGRGEEGWADTRAFKCLHEHCKDKTLKDITAWGESSGAPAVSGHDVAPRLQQNDPRPLTQILLEQVSSADEDTLTSAVASAIKGATLTPEDRERLCREYQRRYEALTDVRLPIATVRSRLAGARLSEATHSDRPAWAAPWVWVDTHGQFFNTEAYLFTKRDTFNAEYTRFVPADENGRRAKAWDHVVSHGFVDVAARPIYMPTVRDALFTVDGERVVNTFNHATLPVPAAAYTADGEAYLDFVERHLDLLCGGREEGRILLQWMAHQVQRPGIKLRWAPLIRSIEGVGKSFIAEVLRVCLGVRNVGVVKPSEVTSQFNSWAANHIVNVLEELKIAGHNRYEALNSLKPLVTDDFIQINGKGVDQYKTQNFANYIGFTNYRDALPLDANDRRWWAVECPLDSLDDLPGGKDAYYDRLWGGLRGMPDQVCAWLHDVAISEEFLALKQAPMTKTKAQMISTEDATMLGLIEVKDAIAEGGAWVCQECLSSVHLWAKVKVDNPDLYVSNKDKGLILKRLGYTLNAERGMLGKRKTQLWSRHPMSASEFRAHFPGGDEVSDTIVVAAGGFYVHPNVH